MSFNFKSIKIDAATAMDIVQKAITYVQLAEEVAGALGVTGADKLSGVKAAIGGYVSQAYPAIAPQFDTLWAELNAIINGVVALYNAVGFFKKFASAK